MRRTFLTVIALVLLTFSAFSQQKIEFSQYMLNLSANNPAAAGWNDKINVIGVFRSQYAGIEGAPLTYNIAADIGFNIGKTKHGAGIQFYSNTVGLFRFQDINIEYAYRFPIQKGFLSAGLFINFTTLNIDTENIYQPEDDYHQESDPAIPQSKGNDFKVDLGVGFMYKCDKWFAGISLLNLLSPEYELSTNTKFKKTMNMYFSGGYNISLKNPLYKIKTSAIVNTDFASWSGIVSANLEYNEKYWGGIGYRIDGAVVFQVGMKIIDGLVLGYSFDLPTSALISSAGSHEVILSYSFNIDLSKKNKYKSIRYL